MYKGVEIATEIKKKKKTLSLKIFQVIQLSFNLKQNQNDDTILGMIQAGQNLGILGTLAAILSEKTCLFNVAFISEIAHSSKISDCLSFPKLEGVT